MTFDYLLSRRPRRWLRRSTTLLLKLVDQLKDWLFVIDARHDSLLGDGLVVQVFLNQTAEQSSDVWLTAVQEGVYWDLRQLNGETTGAAASAAVLQAGSNA
ncbi:hypothetical protein [Bradyrhizobium sp. WSM1253]|uniref:hypothetical protein n=1 Tax=Bradyrhizobium sp. WSM1253 TaxID=319003 RepID=UPI00025D1972|nr:hypothetical protein [Bradyrhizobium sp. WSM1253]EIG56179.1 hypothetical protein Bra1253DRAFT_00787 [Bradyrhizobium sp. WSM1253]